MTSFNELVIGSSQGFAFLLKIITEVFQDYVHLQGHGLAMISHKCEPSVSKEFNLFSVVDFYCLCMCHSNSPTVCSALKNGHLLCRIEHFHFLDGILTSLCIFYSLLFTVLSLSWTVCLWGKLAVLLQRGNAAILGNRVPDFPAPAIDGRHWDPQRVPWAAAFIGPWGFSSAVIDRKHREKDA